MHCPFSYFLFFLHSIQLTAQALTQHQSLKKSDDYAIEDFSNSDSVYFAEVERFSNWGRDNSLDSNVKKTKEMLTDFRKAPTATLDLFTDGVKVEWVTEYKYLGIVLDNKLNLNKTLILSTQFVSQEYLAFKS